MRFIAALILTLPVLAQQIPSGAIFGLLSDNVAHLVASAPMHARNVATGAVFDVTSGDAGHYRFIGLPPGEYEVTVRIDQVGDFPQKRVVVKEDQPTRLDIILPLP